METAYAYATFITNDQWVIGAEVLMNSLKKFSASSDIDKLILVTQEVSQTARTKLHRTGAKIHEVDAITIQNPELHGHVKSWTDVGYTKLAIWGLTSYSKVFYIDADCLVMDDVAEVFDRDVEFAAAPDVFPPDRFNAGVMLIKPDLAVLNDMLDKAKTMHSYDGGDTGFLNAYYHNWFELPQIHRLPFRYNAQRTLYWMTNKRNPGYWKAIEPIKIIHFSSTPKPWEDTSRKGDLEMLWWTSLAASQIAL